MRTYQQVNTNQSKTANDTAASVMFWFWFVVQARIIFGYLLFYDHETYATLVNGVISLSFAAIVIVLFATTDRALPSFEWSSTAKLVFIFLGWSGITVSWTRANSQFIAFAYWAELALEVFVVFMLLKTNAIEQVGEAFLRGFILGTSAIALVAVVLNPQSEVRGGLGDAGHLHPNFIANYFALGSLFSLHLALKEKQKQDTTIVWWVLSLFLLVALFRTLGKTMIVGFVVALVLYAGSSYVSRRSKILLATVVLFLLFVSVWTSWSYFQLYVHNEDDATLTLTSRTFLWADTWEMIKERPILGYGILSFRDYGPQIAEFRLVHAHNEWVMLWFQTGLIGVAIASAIYVTYFISVRRTLKRCPQSPPGRLGMALVAYMLIRGVTDASITDLVFYLPMLLSLLPWTTRAGLTDQCVVPRGRYAEAITRQELGGVPG